MTAAQPLLLDFVAHFARTTPQKLAVADFQKELEAYTGRSWDEFFKNWFYGVGATDWAVVSVKTEHTSLVGAGIRTTVVLRQNAEFTEPTYLGIRFRGEGFYASGPVAVYVDEDEIGSLLSFFNTFDTASAAFKPEKDK